MRAEQEQVARTQVEHPDDVAQPDRAAARTAACVRRACSVEDRCPDLEGVGLP